MTIEAVEVMCDGGRAKPTSIADPGCINRELAEALEQHVPASILGPRIRELIDAVRYDKLGKESPDIRAREAGLKLALAYKVGLPVQRSETLLVSADADSAVGMEERLRHSPALRALFRKMLDRVEPGEG